MAYRAVVEMSTLLLFIPSFCKEIFACWIYLSTWSAAQRSWELSWVLLPNNPLRWYNRYGNDR